MQFQIGLLLVCSGGGKESRHVRVSESHFSFVKTTRLTNASPEAHPVICDVGNFPPFTMTINSPGVCIVFFGGLLDAKQIGRHIKTLQPEVTYLIFSPRTGPGLGIENPE